MQLLRLNRPQFSSLLLSLAALFLTVSMVRFPEQAFEASLHGLSVWWNIVFPALLPFFIFSQILIGLGVVHMMGVFLEPVMRPVFNVPGVGSFVLAMGLASGFPLGAILTADMRRKEMVSKVEAERLVSFVNTADPLFLFGAVAVGMFGYPEIGITIAITHYLSSISMGFIMRFYGRDPSPTPETPRKGSIFIHALNTMLQARRQDGRTPGKLMGDAIETSINTQLLIGGFIILFSVIISILDAMGAVALLADGLSPLLKLAGLDPSLGTALINGFFEIDLGCQVAAEAENVIALEQRIIAASMIIAWSGLSVHAQVASIVSDTDIDTKPYIIARLIHSILAGFYTFLLYKFGLQAVQETSIPTFLLTVPDGTFTYWWTRTHYVFQKISFFFLAVFILSLAMHFLTRVKTVFFHHK